MFVFPLLKLPQLAQKVVVNQMDLVAAIELSMVSKKFKKVLKHVKITVQTFEYNFATNSYSFLIDTPSKSFIISPTFSCHNLGAKWNINGSDLLVIEKTYDYILGHTRFLVKCEEDTNVSKLEILEKLTKYLLSFLKVKSFKVLICGKIDIFKLFIWKCTKHFDEILYFNNFGESVYLTPDELKFFLEDLTIHYLSLRVQIKNNPDFKYHPQNEGSSKIRKIDIENPSWVNFDNLLNMANESITSCIPSDEANGILKKWMSGTNEKLEDLQFWPVEDEEFVKEEVLNGTNAMPSAFTRDELEKRSNLNLSQRYTMMDIRRVHDGCQATIILTDQYIRLCVWNEKHLNAIGKI